MYIKKIKLKNFRNYEEEEFIFKNNFNIIYGDNAQGKTNILEAIYLSSIGRSFRTKKDSDLIKIGSDKAIIERFVVAKQVSDIHSNLWSQKVIAKFLQEYDMDNHLFQLSQIYQRKCQLMYNQMKKHFHPDIIFNKPSGGMFIWVTFPKSVDIEDFIKKALDLKVAVVPGKVFLVDDKEECHSIRLNFSTPTDEQIIKGISILGKLTYNLV